LLNSSGHLEDINKYVTEKKEKWCPNCKKINRNSKRVLQEHILLETDVFKDNTINENKILVNDIPSKLFIGKER
jgi:phage FluMu protein Com